MGILDELTGEKRNILKETWTECFSQVASSKPLHERWKSSFNLTDAEIIESIRYELYDLAAYDDMDLTMLRFLRARKYNVPDTLKMFFEALHWRKTVEIRTVLEQGESALKQELVDAQMYFIWGQDNEGRPVIIFNVGNFLPTHSKEDTELFKKYIIYHMESARLFVGEKGVMTLADLSTFGRKNIDLDFAKVFAEIFQNYYPETLGRAVVVGSGLKMTLFEGVWSVAKFFLDPEVRKKISFAKAKELTKYMDQKFIPKSLGGLFEENKVRASVEPEGKATTLNPSLRTKQLQQLSEFESLAFDDPARVQKKKELAASWLEMANHRPKNLYQRLGLLKDGKVNWDLVS